MSARVLGPAGEFRQITNMPWVYLKLYRTYFRDVSFRLVPLNLPPGGVYFCRGYAPAAWSFKFQVSSCAFRAVIAGRGSRTALGGPATSINLKLETRNMKLEVESSG